MVVNMWISNTQGVWPMQSLRKTMINKIQWCCSKSTEGDCESLIKVLAKLEGSF